MRAKLEKRNIILFIISYVINNLASGILYDTYVNYLQIISVDIATSFWAFYGYATFIAALLLLIVPKYGYKRLLILCTLGTSLSFFIAVYGQNVILLNIATALSLTGVQLYFIVLSPFIATFSKSLGDEDIDWYSRTYYMGYIGYFLSTYLGGMLVVRIFANIANISYLQAKDLTRFIEELDINTLNLYLKANEIVLIGFGILSLLSLIPIFLIKEEKEDYEVKNIKKLDLKEKLREFRNVLLSKPALFYILYWMIVSFAMGLFTSYYTVFLNRVLHIDKVTSSLLVSISYIAIVVFMFFTPFCVKKLGRVGTIALTMGMSIPFMLLIANGDKFGGGMVFVVGISLFMRAGMANLGSPADSALSMDVVSNELRPIYTSLINIASGLISIVSGIFTGKYLFKTLEGYRYAYYIAALLYILAFTLLFIGCKDFNQKKTDE